jgi:hypothetical protein
MVNRKSININKTNYHHTPQTIEHKNDPDIGNPGPGFRQAHKCGKVKSVNGIANPLPL